MYSIPTPLASGGGQSDFVTVLIAPVNDAPVAVDDAAAVDEEAVGIPPRTLGLRGFLGTVADLIVCRIGIFQTY